MSRKGDGLDNAVAERFFGSVKCQRTSLQHHARHQEAGEDAINYIYVFYNSKQLQLHLMTVRGWTGWPNSVSVFT
jgi:putative transposase